MFAFTQVTALLAEDLTGTGMLRGIALLLVVWWAWVGYSWLTNSVPVDDDIRSRVVVFAAMAAGLVMGLAIPQAFSGDGVLFGFAYLTVTLLFVLLYAVSTRDKPEMNRAVLRMAPGVLAAPVLVAIAGFLDAGRPSRRALDARADPDDDRAAHLRYPGVARATSALCRASWPDHHHRAR